MTPDEREGHRDRGVLTHLVDVVIHPQLVRAQRRLVAPAVRQHAVALVGEALVVERLERPEHALHVVRVERLVAALEVDPSGLAADVVLPLARVGEHRLAGLRVERVDAHRLDLGLLGDAELLHRLQLGRQAVRVPPEDAVDAVAGHRLEAREHVLRVAGQEVPVVREAVRERRAVVEDPLRGALALRDARPEGVVGAPELLHLRLDRGKAGARRDVGSGLRVRHVTPAGCDASCEDDPPDRRNRGTTPLSEPRPALLPERTLSFCGCDGPAPFGSTEPPRGPFFRRLPGDGRIDVCPSILPGGDPRRPSPRESVVRPKIGATRGVSVAVVILGEGVVWTRSSNVRRSGKMDARDLFCTAGALRLPRPPRRLGVDGRNLARVLRLLRLRLLLGLLHRAPLLRAARPVRRAAARVHDGRRRIHRAPDRRRRSSGTWATGSAGARRCSGPSA